MLALLALLTTLSTSCSAREGWALVLWPPEGSAIGYGAVVPVHFKSNITRTYAVGVPGSKAKEELELWRVEPYRTKAKATQAAAALGDLAPVLGLALRDGLLLRARPENSSEQVYRLRLGQAVKLLKKVDGGAVETGGESLDGNWYLALAEDGSSGYIFSNQLRLWNAGEGPAPAQTSAAPSPEAAIATLLDTVWRPEYFDTMVASGRLDLATYQPRFGIFSDPLRKQIRVERPGFSKVYRYESFSPRDDGSLEMLPAGALFRFSPDGSLLFQPPESDVPPEALALAREERGDDASVVYGFVRHDGDVLALIAQEERRRLSLLSDFVSEGERYESSAHGVLIVTRSARFTWVAYGALSPAIIPEAAGETGSISMDLYLSPELAAEWNGAFTLRFDGGTRPAVSFAYRLRGDELSLAFVPPALVRNAVVTAPEGLDPAVSMTRYR